MDSKQPSDNPECVSTSWKEDEWLTPLIEKRFNYVLTKEEISQELDDEEKILKRVKFPPFSFSTEEAFEDWVDAVAVQARQEKLSVRLFQAAWASAATAQPMALMSPPPDTYEELITLVAGEKFNKSRYLFALENDLKNGRRHPNVQDTERWLKGKVNRYLRLCKRKSRRPGLSKEGIAEVFIRSLPEGVERTLRMKMPPALDFKILFDQARQKEKEMLKSNEEGERGAVNVTRVQAPRLVVEENDSDSSGSQGFRDADRAERMRGATACFVCGHHFLTTLTRAERFAMLKDLRCFNCKRFYLGRIAL